LPSLLLELEGFGAYESRNGVVMPPSIASQEAGTLPPWAGAWLPAGDLVLTGDRIATVSFDREGRCRLLLALDREADADDVAALEEAADALPYLQLGDLEGGEGYPDRHADAFALPEPLPAFAFNSSARVELVARPGGRRLPSRIGGFGLPTRTTLVQPDEEADAGGPGAAAGAPMGEAAAVGEAAPAPPPAVEEGAAAGAVERVLAEVGRRLQALTRLDGATLCGLLLGLAVAGFVLVFVRQTWGLHQHFGTYGYDVGIYDQGTWLLSRLKSPFVTVRGLSLFGEHTPYILALVAPLYRLWSDPRLLLLLQVIALAVPAVVVYRLGTRHLGNPAVGLAVAIAYLAYPAMQWAITWQFHPETLAAAFLALAALDADARRVRRMAVWLGLALLCREDVGLVVAGFGGLLMLSGQRDVGRRVLVAGLAWWVLATFLFIPWANGRQTNLFELNYGISGVGPIALLRALPSMIGRALATALSNQGISYLLLVLVPLLGLPLLAPRALLPVAPALFLNLAAVPPEQHQLRYQYLATSAPLLALAAIAGLKVVASRRRALLAPALIALVVVAIGLDQRYGPALWSKDPVVGATSPADAPRRQALALIPPDAPVSAQFNLVPQLTRRTKIYEFPNPFRAANWGLEGDGHPARDQQELRYVIVDRSLLDKDQQTVLQELQASQDWSTRFDSGGILLLERRGAAAPGASS
jgi:uncharacterized membrane protein